MKKNIFHFILTAGLLVSFLAIGTTKSASVFAQETTASPSGTTQKLKERIEKIVEEKKDQIKDVLSEFDQKKRGTLGNVTRVSEETITIKTRKTTEIVPINTDEVTLLKSGKAISITDIAVGDWAVVMGIIEDDAFKAKRVLVSSTSLRPATPVVTLGTIESVAKTKLTINPRNQNEAFDLTITNKTDFQDINGNDITLTEIKAEMQAIVVGSENEKNEKTATLIRVLTAAKEN